MTTRKRLGFPADLCTQPLVARLGHEDLFDQQVDLPARLAIAMREHRLDAAFLSPIDFARDFAGYTIIPRAGVSSAQGTGTVSLIFRDEHLHTVSTVAIDPSTPSEIVLAKILLAEEFDLAPQFVPATGTIAERLARADAVLLVGDQSLREADRHPNRLDLIEAWVEMVNLPYVHGVWCTPQGGLSAAHIDALTQAAANGASLLEGVASDVAPDRFPSHTRALLVDYLHMFSYTLSDDDLDGMREFLRYAFYHGILPDVPDLTLALPPGEGDDADSPR